MRILQINTADTKGGAGKVAYQLQKELHKIGHDSTLLVSRKYAKDDKNVVLIRPESNLRRRILKKLTYYLANDLDLFWSNNILKTPEFQQADIVHCHNLHTNYFNLATLEKISKLKPIVWTFHDMWPITAHCAHSFDGKIKENGFFTCPSLDIYPPIAWHNEKYLESKKRKTYENSNFHIVVPSLWLKNKVENSLLASRPITLIYNGIDTTIFKPLNKQECRNELGLPQDKKIILFLAKRGRSNPWKGGAYAEDALNGVKNRSDIFILDIGGDENKTIGNRKFVSFVNDEKTLAKYYAASDIFLYTSLADNCPLVALEAQACGLPVVSFATGGIPELVDHQKTGYIARYKDADDLISGVRWMLSRSSTEYATMREAAIAKIHSGFTLDRMTEQYLELYKQKIKLKFYNK
ncbi:MAG: glycosyltransferase [bacterium]|nr:glycosyltransferase [bacterium]